MKRIIFVQILIFFIGLVLLWRVFYFSVINHKIPESFSSQNNYQDPSFRGEVFLYDKDGNSYPIALNKLYYNISINPKIIKQEDLDKIKDIVVHFNRQNDSQVSISQNKTDVINKIMDKISKRDSSYITIATKIDTSDPVILQLKTTRIAGVNLEAYYDRYYPLNNILSQLIGFYGYKDDKKEGLYGIENYYNDYLTGIHKNSIDNKNLLEKLSYFLIPQAINSDLNNNVKLILTIEPNLNQKTDEILGKIVSKFSAESGLISVMDPNTGEILSLSSIPNFDPNNYSKVSDYNIFLNPLVSSTFEPGSIFKIFTFALGFYYKKIEPNEFYTDYGYIKSDGHIIKNAANKVYGYISLKEGLIKSINTAAMYVANKLSQDEYTKGLEKLGFNELTGIDSPYETRGSILNVYSGRDVDKMVSSFGQGISMTPIRFMSSAASLINGGKILKPYFLKKILRGDQVLYEAKPEIKAQVLDDYSRNLVKNLMAQVVDNGTAKRAKIKGYVIGAKTGTAQIPSTDKKGYSEEYNIHSIVSFAPYKDTKFLVFIRLDKPKNVRFAEETVVPALKELYDYLFYYYNIKPEE